LAKKCHGIIYHILDDTPPGVSAGVPGPGIFLRGLAYGGPRKGPPPRSAAAPAAGVHHAGHSFACVGRGQVAALIPGHHVPGGRGAGAGACVWARVCVCVCVCVCSRIRCLRVGARARLYVYACVKQTVRVFL